MNRLCISLLIIALVSPLPVTALQTAPRGPIQEASRLDTQGSTKEARAIFQTVIDSATAPGRKAAAQRAMAMSYAFDGDCANTWKYEQMVIDYWKTRETAEPQNAFYQQGEMANEAARVCADAGDHATAERMYRRGSELGNREPEPRTHPRSLWDYRLHHALARINARRGNRDEALFQMESARRALDADTAMARQQERFYPYLVGYVALYGNDLRNAETELTRAVAMQGNERDPFQHLLLAMTYEKMNQRVRAREFYQKAYEMATAHNPPAVHTRPVARKKLGIASPEP